MRLAIFVIAVALIGCRKEDMAEQPRPNTHDPSAFFEDQSSARSLPQGVVARSGGPSDDYVFDRSLLAASNFPADFPLRGPELATRLSRGQERYNIYCAVCHGETGAGDGMIVRRGFTVPPAFFPLAEHEKSRPDLFKREQNLLSVPPGYVYEKITNGYGAMYSYAARVPPEDRWNIAAYVRALQLARNVEPQ